MRILTNRRTVLAAAVAGALGIALAAPAMADYAPGSNDVVGAGSDTLQYMLDFAADGHPAITGFAAASGYNGIGNSYKLVSIDATADSNARAAYANGSTSASLKPLNPSTVFRAGMLPFYRPNGSGDGQAILGNSVDIVGGGTWSSTSQSSVINFVRSSSKNGTTNGYELVRIAKEDLAIAVNATTTNATAALTTLQLANIYECNTNYLHWSDSGVYGAGASGDTIVPEIPQSGSGTRNTFLDNLGAAIGGLDHTNFPLGSCVVTVEENDPTSVGTTNYTATPADAIVPFSSARLALYNDHYFQTPGNKFGTAQTFVSPNALQIGVGVANSGTGASNLYDNHRSLYIMLDPGDINNAVGWQPGQTNTVANNWAHDLFIGAFSYMGSATGQALVAAAGGSTVTGDGYSDCGVVTSC